MTRTARLDVQIPVELFERLEYVARLPRNQNFVGTFEALAVCRRVDGALRRSLAKDGEL